MTDLSEKKFLEELEKLNTSLVVDIEANRRQMDPSLAAKEARRLRVFSGDYAFFVYTYFPHHMWLDEGQKASTFQSDFMTWLPQALALTSGWQDWWVAPRGEGKSTLATKLTPIYIAVIALLQDPEVRRITGLSKPSVFLDFCILFGAETKMPAKTLEVVKTELLNNANLALDFPEVCKPTAIWKIGEFVTATNVRFESRGAEQAVRGAFHNASRPKFLMFDDIIKDDEAKSPTEREKRWQFIEACAQYLGPPDGTVKCLGVNTVLHHDDPISRAKKAVGHVVHVYQAIERMPEDMDLWARCEELMLIDDKDYIKRQNDKGRAAPKEDWPSYKFWQKHKRAMNKGAKTSWPCVRSIYDLMALRAKNEREFNREMQGISRALGEQVFTNFTFWVNRLADWKPFGACDPSMGANETADPSAILTGFYNMEDVALHVEYESRKRRSPTKLLSDLIRAQENFQCLKWSFESNNAYEYMRTDFIKRALAKAREKDIELKLFPEVATTHQYLRIESLELDINDNPATIQLHSRCKLLKEELEQFPEKPGDHHFDLSCALWLLKQVAFKSKREKRTPRSRRPKARSRLQGYNA